MDPDFVDISNLNSVADIKNVCYINLVERTDRKEHVKQQLSSVKLTQVERFNAIKLPNGALGCSMSHLKCLQFAKERKLDHVLIVEDDITFLNPLVFTKQLNRFLENNNAYILFFLYVYSSFILEKNFSKA